MASLTRDFRLDVERAGRFVEDEDRRVLQDSAGDRDALALAARQLAAALAGRRIVAFALRQDEVMRSCGLGGGVDLVADGGRAADPDVLLDRAVEQPGILEDRRDRLAQRLAGDGGDIDAVDQDAALLRRVDALQAG